MTTTARGDADGRQAALAATCTTDPGTMRRVGDLLRSTMAGVDPLSRHEQVRLPAHTLERRVVTWLRPMPPGGAR